LILLPKSKIGCFCVCLLSLLEGGLHAFGAAPGRRDTDLIQLSASGRLLAGIHVVVILQKQFASSLGQFGWGRRSTFPRSTPLWPHPTEKTTF
jgi:hypothetical protein